MMLSKLLVSNCTNRWCTWSQFIWCWS